MPPTSTPTNWDNAISALTTNLQAIQTEIDGHKTDLDSQVATSQATVTPDNFKTINDQVNQLQFEYNSYMQGLPISINILNSQIHELITSFNAKNLS